MLHRKAEICTQEWPVILLLLLRYLCAYGELRLFFMSLKNELINKRFSPAQNNIPYTNVTLGLREHGKVNEKLNVQPSPYYKYDIQRHLAL